MRVLVTGGAGFIGSHVAERMVAHGHETAVVDDLSSGRLGNLDASRHDTRVQFHRFDIRGEGVRHLIAQLKPDVICHLAAQPSVPRSVMDPVHDAQVNVVGLLNVLEAAVAASVRKIVFASSGGTIYGEQTDLPIPESAVGRPSAPYGISKRVAEDYLRFYQRERGLEFTSLALANVYGPRQDPHGESGVIAIFARNIALGRPCTINGDGSFTRDFVYVDDVAHAFVLACTRGSGQTVNIGTGAETSIAKLYATMAEVAGFDQPPHHGPPQAGDLRRSALDPSKASAVLDWRPWTKLPEGLSETLAWFAHEYRDA